MSSWPSPSHTVHGTLSCPSMKKPSCVGSGATAPGCMVPFIGLSAFIVCPLANTESRSIGARRLPFPIVCLCMEALFVRRGVPNALSSGARRHGSPFSMPKASWRTTRWRPRLNALGRGEAPVCGCIFRCQGGYVCSSGACTGCHGDVLRIIGRPSPVEEYP